MGDAGVQSWPKVTIRLYDTHNAAVEIAGRSHAINSRDPRESAVSLVSKQATQLGRPVKATAIESDGTSWRLIIHPDGTVEPIEVDPRAGPRLGSGRSP